MAERHTVAGLPPLDFRYGRFPNGWPHPTFLDMTPVNGLSIEWCFGEQGADDSWRVLFSWDEESGAMVCCTTKAGQEFFGTEEGHTGTQIADALQRWLGGVQSDG